MKKFYSIREVCEMAGVSRATVQRRLDDGTLQSIKLGTARRITVSSLNGWLGGTLAEETACAVRGR
ncbi:helix-turn-helix domain-containing protein [Acetobacter sacchari]|uniref:Helix-turn-helix domain-containing protein n=1 Tax=Acetobacter sacchari TaxID=2661687 RepID=A0ABS3LZT4_9PROT|nr:helix-turn-helix domain-containing protein [Acetobacter sacchari]MBO1361432.1 helix-turn-helix domain-containing protein [Acetobacter sacchari]